MYESYEELAADVLAELLPGWIDAYQDRIEKQGSVLTQDLLHDFRTRIIKSAGTVSAEIQFRKYGRYRDMKRLNFRNVPDIDAMTDFVEKVGVENFVFVPGYVGTNRPPTVSKAVARIAAGVAFGFWRRSVAQRDGKGWYNTTTMEQLNLGKQQLRTKLNAWFRKELITFGEKQI